MSRFVVDASVVLAWCFPDENDENAALSQGVAHRFAQGDSAVAPSFWPHEVMNALLAGEKRRRITRDLMQKFLADLASLPIALAEVTTESVFGQVQALSRDHGLTAYGAAYLDLAKTLGMPLATLDDDLVRACRKAGVELV